MDRSLARHAGLLVVVFVATLVLLAGGWALVGQSGANSASPRSSSLAGSVGPVPIASASAGALPSASGPIGSSAQDVVLTGAGDIADCSSTGAAQTSDLLVNQSGTIFTAGDNAYENGSEAEFAACYQPTWGRVKDRTLPVPAPNSFSPSTPDSTTLGSSHKPR
jgi:hypothetical protein